MNPLILKTLLLIVLLTASTKCWDWDPLDLEKNIQTTKTTTNTIIEKILSGDNQQIQKVKRAVEEVLDPLFDEKFLQLLYQIQSIIDKNFKQITYHIQEEINKVLDKIFDLVTQTANKGKELIDKPLEEIIAILKNESSHKADILTYDITADTIRNLDKVDLSIYNISCSDKTLADKLIYAVVKDLPWIPNPWDKCRILTDKKFPWKSVLYKLFKFFTLNELYEYMKCNLFVDYNGKSPIDNILKTYRELELFAGDMRCASVALVAPENLVYFVNEMVDSIRRIEIYQKLLNWN